jgi:uncharacterized protein YihD (DUF1040 family)
MRDQKRIPEILNLLGRYWSQHPELRLGQLMRNLNIDYLTEDWVLKDALEWKLEQESVD